MKKKRERVSADFLKHINKLTKIKSEKEQFIKIFKIENKTLLNNNK